MEQREKLNGFSTSGTQLVIRLQNAGLCDDFKSKKLRCACCDVLLDGDNIGCVLQNDSTLKGLASCQDESCMENVQKWMNISL